MRSASLSIRGQRPFNAGFTLVELLIVITIILIILGMTLATINYSRSSDRVAGAARQVQSFIAGARSRAMYARESRGVRLFIEQDLGGSPAGLRTVTTLAYISPGGTWAAPKDSSLIQLERIDGNGDGKYDDESDLITLVRGFNNPGWWNLKRRGMLFDGMRIRIPAGTGSWYPISVGTDITNPTLDITNAPPDEQLLSLQVPYGNDGNSASKTRVLPGKLTYEIELPTRLLPQDPSVLPDGIVIDLDGSKVPNSWRPSSIAGAYSGYMDIIFSPRGNIIGDAAGEGVLHLYICDREDSLFLKEEWVAANSIAAFDSAVAGGGYFIPIDTLRGEFSPNVGSATDPYFVSDRRIVSLFAQTGVIKSFQVNAFEDSPSALGIATQPFYFAETGEVAQ
ncbi:MAG: prepilin-type N-terminal cleavage/methylation domain-containing protein [Planctomycetaceae bacterium]